MEVSHLEKSPQLCHLGDSDDAAKYVSGLSTLLVATIQEAKDRISQIEYIFCSQLYPNFQKNSKSLQKLYSEAKRAAEEEYKQREFQLELCLQDLRLEKEQLLEDYSVLKTDKSKLLRRIAELEERLLLKTKEIDDGMTLHGKLCHLLETKTFIIASKEKQAKENEESIKLLLAKLQGLEETINAGNKELQGKDVDLTKEKELNQELLRQIESHAQKITSNERTISNMEMDKNQLINELKNVSTTLDHLRDELREKAVELEEGNKLREQLAQQVNLSGLELTKKDQQLSAHEKEKNLLSSRITDLENTVNVLNNLKGEVSGKSMRSESPDDLLKQIELKNAELLKERQYNRQVLASYKKLKSQNNFLLSKVALNKENSLLHVKLEGEKDPLNHDTPPEIKDRTPVSTEIAGGIMKVKREIDPRESSNVEKGVGLNQKKISPFSSSSKSFIANNQVVNGKLISSTGTKRPAAGWRDTRSCQSHIGPDPHDDFLDTPYENIRENLHKVKKDFAHKIPDQVSKHMDPDGSDDETQDMQFESSSIKQQVRASKPSSIGFKHVESVRKKSERDNLNGIECNQCKKFYDAVLSDAVGKDGEVDKRKFRCEHHDGVSRHRYKYVPPMTPEGFWNIGFDTET